MTVIVRTLEYPAAKMNGQDRKVLALKSLSLEDTVIALAKQNQVSRQFIHAQKNKLLRSVDNEFSEKEEEEEKVLFNLPVTKSWIPEFV